MICDHIQIIYKRKFYINTVDMQNPKAYLLLHNVSKRNNVGNIIRSACAFGIQKVMFISNRPQTKKTKILKQFNMFGNQGTYKHMEYQPYGSLEQCKKILNQKGIRICGVEIGEGSLPIQEHPFTGSTAFFLGNEGTGLLSVHKKYCDFFVYIPQYTDKTASLNVSVAAGIIFHHFALWAKYPQAKVYGQKYQLQQQGKQGEQSEQKQEQSQKEKQKSEAKIQTEQQKVQILQQLVQQDLY